MQSSIRAVAGTTVTTLGWSCRSAERHSAKKSHKRHEMPLLQQQQRPAPSVIIGVMPQSLL